MKIIHSAAAAVQSRMTIIQRGYEAIHEQGEQIREKVGNTFAKSLFWPARPRSSKPRQNFSDIFSKILTYSSSNFIKKNFHGL